MSEPVPKKNPCYAFGVKSCRARLSAAHKVDWSVTTDLVTCAGHRRSVVDMLIVQQSTITPKTGILVRNAWHIDCFWPEHPKLSCSCIRDVTKSPKSSHITPVLKSLHWLERIKYKLFSLIYKVLTTNQPQCLHNLISIQPCCNIRSSSVVTLARPPTRSSLKIANRSFRYAAPCLWNELPTDLREPQVKSSLIMNFAAKLAE